MAAVASGRGPRLRWHRVVRSEEVGSRLTRVEVAGRQVLAGRLIGGEVVVVSPTCPHQHLPMDGGSVLGDEIACPHHQYTYDARTGVNRYPKKVFPPAKAREVEGVGVHPAREEDGWVWIGLETEPSSQI